MSTNNFLPASSIDFIALHILQVIDQLSKPIQSQHINKKVNAVNNSNAIKNPNININDSDSEDKLALSVLLVSDNSINANISQFLTKNSPQTIVKNLTINEFSSSPFDKRYALGCLIIPSIIRNLNNDATGVVCEVKDLANLNNIAIRLRDLFAEQSLILTYASSSELNFNCLGYIPLPIETSDNSPSLISWQFNLYDYKHRPDWLNSKYWANPENFDKYRW
ncbi:DUF6231 family protein [Psychrobacter sp.]|uniref:DUF6231 family protein n=1 Tax=Psychrobacter sp. TaxID=56811 RepID=UPI0025FA7EAE|nr:DUF6231 family protein [Psychrobacter sp.]